MCRPNEGVCEAVQTYDEFGIAGVGVVYLCVCRSVEEYTAWLAWGTVSAPVCEWGVISLLVFDR